MVACNPQVWERPKAAADEPFHGAIVVAARHECLHQIPARTVGDPLVW